MSVEIRLLIVVALAALAGCEQPSPRTSSNAAATINAPESSRDFGDFVVHVNAINTDQLTPEVARQYAIVRSPNRAMLNVSILRKDTGTSGVPVSGRVGASAVNLTGQAKSLELREIREEDAVYYIAEFAVANEETLIFSIDVTPIDEPSTFSVRYRRQFYVN